MYYGNRYLNRCIGKLTHHSYYGVRIFCKPSNLIERSNEVLRKMGLMVSHKTNSYILCIAKPLTAFFSYCQFTKTTFSLQKALVNLLHAKSSFIRNTDLCTGKEEQYDISFPVHNIFTSLMYSNTLCIWTEEIDDCVQKNVIGYVTQKRLRYVIKHFDYGATDVSAKQCYDNILFNFTFQRGNHFFKDRMPSMKHLFVIVNLESNNTENFEFSSNTFKVFGLAKVVVLQNTRAFKLSSPFIPPRTFEMITSKSKFEDKFVANLQGRKVKVVTFNCSLFSILQGPLNSGTQDGIEMLMMRELAERVNFTWIFVDPNGDWGNMLPNGSWTGGVAGTLESGDADLGFCNIWNILPYSFPVDFGPPWNVVYPGFLVPRPHLVYGYWIIMIQLFEKSVWIILLTTFVSISYLLWKSRSPPNNNNISGAVESILTVFGMTIGCTCYIPSSVKITRQIISSWSLLSFFVSAIFSNTMLSRLMVPYYTSPMDSVKDLVKSNFQWGEPGFEQISEREVYFNLEDPWQRKFVSRYQELTKNTSRTALLSGKFAFPVTRLGHDYTFVNIDGVNETKDFRGFRVMKEPLNEFYVSLVFNKHSPILEICRGTLQRFFQVGLVNYWKKDVILRHGNADIEQLLYDSSTETVVNSFEPLTLSNNLAAFRILLSGLILAVLVFAYELLNGSQS